MRNNLNSCINGFRKSHRTQHSVAVMLEKCKRFIDKGECVSLLFLNHLNAFHTINHDKMIAKLKAYGISEEALKFMQSYLKTRKQRVQINSKFSSERDVIAAVPQGSKDVHLLFK